MTNKIEISRELLDRMINALDDEGWHMLADEVHEILAAPAVERQEPVGFRYRAHGGHWEWMDESPFADGREHYKLGGEELQPLYTSPPSPLAVGLPSQKAVAYVLTMDGEVCYEADDGVVISNTPGDETDLYKWEPVYFELPAAVDILDENSEFESQMGGKLMGNRHGERLVRDSYGIYRDPKVRTLWMGWQARACLDKVKEMNE